MVRYSMLILTVATLVALETGHAVAGSRSPGAVSTVVKVLSLSSTDDTIVVSTSIANQSKVPADRIRIRYYLVPRSSTEADRLLLGARTVRSVPANSSLSMVTVLPLPRSTVPGSFDVVAVADQGVMLGPRNERDKAPESVAPVAASSPRAPNAAPEAVPPTATSSLVSSPVTVPTGTTASPAQSPVTVATAVTASSPFYGSGVGADGLSNAQIGGTDAGRGTNREVAFRFRAERSVALTSVRLFQKYTSTTAGYSAGTGGTIEYSIREDDGSAQHHPVEASLGSLVIERPITTSTPFPLLVFSRPPVVRQGELYHLVARN